MKVGDLVRYIPYGHDEATEDIGIIVNIDENGYYEVRWCDGESLEWFVWHELEVVCK